MIVKIKHEHHRDSISFCQRPMMATVTRQVAVRTCFTSLICVTFTLYTHWRKHGLAGYRNTFTFPCNHSSYWTCFVAHHIRLHPAQFLSAAYSPNISYHNPPIRFTEITLPIARRAHKIYFHRHHPVTSHLSDLPRRFTEVRAKITYNAFVSRPYQSRYPGSYSSKFDRHIHS